MDHKEKYNKLVNAIKVLQEANPSDEVIQNFVNDNVPELKESEDKIIRKWIKKELESKYVVDNIVNNVMADKALAWLEKQGSEPNWCHHKVDLSNCPEEYRKAYYDGWNNCNMQHSQRKSEGDDEEKVLIGARKDVALSIMNFLDRNTLGMDLSSMERADLESAVIDSDWSKVYDYMKKKLEKQGERKEANLVEILKHYPKETELYSPLYGRLWLAEVDEKNEIITCYKHRLEEGCTRAVLEQEDTVSFYSNGTTGLSDFNTSKDCMLFLYDIAKQGEQKPTWSHEDDVMVHDILGLLPVKSRPEYNQRRANWIKSLKDRVQPHPKQEWSEEDEDMIQALNACIDATIKSGMNYISFDSKSILIGKVKNWAKSIKNRVIPQPKQEWDGTEIAPPIDSDVCG